MAQPSDYSYWIAFAVHAVVGMMSEADSVMESYGPEVRRVARVLRKRKPVRARRLYRGVLLEPEELSDGVLHQNEELRFVSFSEDRNVACWFADPASIMSGYVAQIRPRARGYVMAYSPRANDVLFHHSWRRIRIPTVGEVDIACQARRYPRIAPIVDQLEWALETQKEVIVKPLRRGEPVVAHELSGCPPTDELDAAYTMPRFRENPSEIDTLRSWMR